MEGKQRAIRIGIAQSSVNGDDAPVSPVWTHTVGLLSKLLVSVRFTGLSSFYEQVYTQHGAAQQYGQIRKHKDRLKDVLRDDTSSSLSIFGLTSFLRMGL